MPLTFAYLGSDGLPRATDYQGWRRWFEDDGERQMKIKRSRVNGWDIHTWFQGCSTIEDGPFLFWEVSANHSTWSPLVRRFRTKEEALNYHAFLVKEARADRLQDIPENFYL
jgi:hypothetical protein